MPSEPHYIMETLRYHIAITLLKALALLPLNVLYVISSIAYPIVYYVFKYRRSKSHRNLVNAFPEKDEKEIGRIERCFYRNLCDLFVESIKLLHVSDSTMQSRVTVTGTELMEKAAADSRPVFLFIGHIGNWEWVQEITKRIKAPTVHGELYRPQHNRVFDRVMQTIRNTRYPTCLISMKQAVRAIFRMRQDYKSFLIGFIGDQRPSRKSLHHWMTFMNQDTPILVGGEEIGRHIDAKYLMLHVTRPRRGYYQMDILDMQLGPDSPEPSKERFPYIEMYMHMLEENIREQPEIYLWTHNRWKYKRLPNEDGTWSIGA